MTKKNKKTISTDKEKLIKICKVVEKAIINKTQISLIDKNDINEIKNEWDDKQINNILIKMTALLNQNKYYDVMISPWCLQYGKDYYRGRKRFFSCKLCNYGRRHGICSFSANNLYDSIVKKLKCRIIQMPKLVKGIKIILNKK